MQVYSGFPKHLTWVHITLAVLLVLLAFGLRAAVIVERAASDPTFIPQAGTDHARYVANGAALLRGEWPVEPHYFHPAPSYLFSAIFALLNTTWFAPLIFVIALLDALTAGFLIATGWLLARQAWVGYAAGLIYAVYPVAIFYATTPLIAPLAAFLLATFTLLIFWQREKLTWWRTLLLGFVAGWIVLSRLNLVPIAGLYLLWLLLARSGWQRRIAHGAVFLLVMIATIAPTTWHNYVTSGGEFIAVATTGMDELYMANNRDSAGRHGRTPADLARDRSIPESMIRDIQVAPEHFLGLMGYKFALFWSNLEPGNNLNYPTSRDASFILGALRPFTFLWLLVPGMIGLHWLWRDQRDAALILAGIIGWLFISFMVAFIFSRLRFPVVIPLTLLSAYSLYGLREWWSSTHKRDGLRMIAMPLFICGLMIGFSLWVLYPDLKLPPERRYAEIPADAIRLDADFGEVRLVGWRALDAWPASEQGWLTTRQAYGVELFWQITETTGIDYNFYLSYVDGDQRYSGIDQQIGGISFPAYTTSRWQPDTIYGEIVSIRLDEDVPTERSGQIRVGVWYWDQEGLIVNVPLENGDGNLLIQHLAVYDADAGDAPAQVEDAVIFGERIALLDYALPSAAKSGETVQLDFEWAALTNITRNYTLFLHVVDANETIVAQGDAPPVASILTTNWQPNRPFAAQLSVLMPEQAGVYRVYAGLYDATGRLALANGDDRLFLGTIDVMYE